MSFWTTNQSVRMPGWGWGIIASLIVVSLFAFADWFGLF